MEFYVNEKTTALYTATLKDELDAGIPVDSLATITLTLYDRATGTIINSRDHVDAKNLNGVAIDSSGNLAWTMAPADNAIVGSYELEEHIALFEWTFASGKAGKHERPIYVRNLGKVS